jgi:phosphatidylglycerol lysyltransferase
MFRNQAENTNRQVAVSLQGIAALPSLKRLSPLVAVVVFAVACWLLHRELAHYSFSEIHAALLETPWTRVLPAIALTALSYVVLIGYEWLALQGARVSLPLARVATASLVGFATSFNFGPLFAGTTIRYRLYSAWGIKASEVLNIMSMLLLTFWCGVCTVSAGAFLLVPPQGVGASAGLLAHVPLRIVGAIAAAVVLSYLALNIVRREPVRVGQIVIHLPGLRVATGQVIVASLDLLVAASVLWVLLPTDLGVSYPHLLAGYVLAILAMSLSQVPGGLGVFELVVLSLVVPGKSPAAVGALVLFRLIYFLLPLLVATAVYFAHEWTTYRTELRGLQRGLVRWGGSALPVLLAMLTFVSGAVLLLSGAIPAAPTRLSQLAELLPLGVLETAHLVGSLVGTLLLVLSWGLTRRYDSAWAVASVLVAIGIVAMLVKGFDWEEAVFLAIVLVLLVASRRGFYRRGWLLHAGPSWSWMAAVVIVVGATVWLGTFVYKHVEYSNDLWWHIAFSDNAPRFLRASLVSVVTVLVLTMLRLHRGAPAKHVDPTTSELDLAANILAHQSSAEALLALVGDKTLLFNDERTAFVMYDVRGRSWIALGDPVGTEDQRSALAWQFYELADVHGGMPAFHHVPAASLPLYLQLGLAPTKIGDLARVPLDQFSLEGPKYRDFRRVAGRLERQGLTFEILPADQVPPILPRLREISDQWLADKHVAEKRFSVGFFDEAYLSRLPVAVVRRGDTIEAFANVLATECKRELSADLMRHVADIPNGIMDYLFSQLMLWGKQQGYQSFNLGMAPLSGLDSHPLAPLWNRVGSAIFLHGGHFYNFEGLRQYKAKFHPVWEPLYLMSPGGMALTQVLVDLAALNSGSVKRIVAK